MSQEYFFREKSRDSAMFLENLNLMSMCRVQTVEAVTNDLVDKELLEEIRNIINNDDVSLFFGKTLRDIKLELHDECSRKHNIFMKYMSPRKLVITSVSLPQSSLQNMIFHSIKEVTQVFSKYVKDLSRYFYELEHIDQSCTVMEPLNASFKDDYRRILLDERTWIHIEVTSEGLATNVHLIGQSDYWHDKLQSRLLMWDHDTNIVDNIFSVFEISFFPKSINLNTQTNFEKQIRAVTDLPVCGICLCEELPENPGVPQPLCQNPTCGVYYHRICLYQWLVACTGSRPPVFSVATGACPTCLQPISCSDKDQ